MKPNKRNGLSAAQLKMIAIMSMLTDHLAAVLYPLADEPQQAVGDGIYEAMRFTGRLAFPIFVFFLVEGFFRTSNRKRYFQRLLVFALCSEIPFDMAFAGRFVSCSQQNVGWQLLLIFLMMAANERLRVCLEKKTANRYPFWLGASVVALLFMMAATITRVDYQWGGILLAFLLYMLRNEKPAGIVIAAGGFALYEFTGIPGTLLNILYTGEKGRQKSAFFYWFYPVHLAVLGTVAMFVLR